MVEQAPAKINLGLKILGKRPDGFHDILSLFQTIDLYDLLTFESIDKEKTIFYCNDPDLSGRDDNLVCRAVSVFRAHTGIHQGIRIHLEKRIPVGAGLGGGSSDAAAVLRVLNRLWDTGLSLATLCDLGARLGSDVPFFMQRGTALVTGRGERLQYVSFSEKVVYVLVYPNFQVGTAWAYANFKKTLTVQKGYANFLNSVNPDSICIFDLLRHLENDFLPLIVKTHPETNEILSAFENTGALAASLSGSGSTFFGVYQSETDAVVAQKHFQGAGYQVFLCHPVKIALER